MKKSQHIAVGLSGGVDSAVTALLLKQQGHQVSAIFMRNWEEDADDPFCTAEQDLSDARQVADKLDIPLQVVNFSQAYWDNVFQHCLDEYAAGRTPNPDVWCNREIKFKYLLQHALALGADFLATGHYARIQQRNNHFQLLRGLDKNKDQSYFLYLLNQEQLKNSLFPLGELEKPAVRHLAEQAGFLNYQKKDSTGICFIGERKFKKFLQEFILAKPGDIKTCDGKTIGQHDGIMFYTLGQRRGLDIGGIKAAKEAPWYVITKEIPSNTLIVAQQHDHPQLYCTTVHGSQLHWIAPTKPDLPMCLSAKTRYRQADQACTLLDINGDNFTVTFDQPQWAVTPGQSLVFYQNAQCLGGGIIETTEP